MKRSFVCFLISAFCFACTGQSLPDEYKYDWQNAGNKIVLSNYKNYNFKELIGNQAEKNANSAIQSVLANQGNDTLLLYFPNGTYYFSESIKLPSNTIIRGQSADSTVFIFDLKAEKDLIEISGNETKFSTRLINNAAKKSTEIEVGNSAGFIAGDYIKIIDNDSANISSDWAYGSTAQIVKIKSVNGNIITFESPLRRDFHISKGAKMLKLEMVQNIGIENIKIIRKDETKALTSNISFNYVVNSYAKCIESENCNYAHITLSNSSNINITGNYFHHAFNYGNGGKAYGVAMQFSSGENLIKDNIFNTLRHSILLQAGANGNVIAYNYSINPKWTGVMLPGNAAGDLVLHGNYVYANLFEGNVVQNIVIDNSHGINGPGNTFFRNRAELYGIVMNNNAGGGQVFIGNEITNSGIFMGNYSLTGANYEFANNRLGNIEVQYLEKFNEKSLFIETAPGYYENKNAWPPIGYPNYKNHKIQAEAFFKDGIFIPCLQKIIPKDTLIKDTVIIKDTTKVEDSTSTSLGYFNHEKPAIKLFPNPANNSINILIPGGNIFMKNATIYTLTGRQILTAKSSAINIENLNSGFYLMKILLTDNSISTHKFLKQSD